MMFFKKLRNMFEYKKNGDDISDNEILWWYNKMHIKYAANKAREHYKWIKKCKDDNRRKKELSKKLMKGYMEMYKK